MRTIRNSETADYKLLISFGINIAIVFIAIFVFGSKLFMNDDGSLAFMFFGITTKASSRGYYANIILGYIYQHLHGIWPHINWMTVSYYVGIVFSGTVALNMVLRKDNKKLLFMWILFELAFYHDVYIYLTYSVVAAFVCFQGYLSLFLALDEKKTGIWTYLPIGLCMVFASLLRFDSFLGASAFAFVAWVVSLVVEIKKKKEVKNLLKKYFYPFAAIIGICFAFYIADRAAYSTGEWKAYSEYEDNRQVVTDIRNCAKRETYKPLRELGVNKAQALAVVNFLNNDPEMLDTEVVKKIAGTTKRYNFLTSKYVWKDFIRQWKVIFTKYREIYFSLLCVAYFAWYLKKDSRKWGFLMALFLLLPMLLEIFYFAYIGRMENGEYPERCIYIVLMGVVVEVMSLFTTVELREDVGRKEAIALLGAVFVAAAVIQPTRDFSVNGLGLVDTESVNEKYSFMRNEDKVFVTHYSVMQQVMDDYGAWQLPPTGYLSRCIEIGGWLINHPMQNELQASLGCENPYRALFEKDNVYYITIHSTQDNVLYCLQENYDERIDSEYITEKGNIQVYKYGLE